MPYTTYVSYEKGDREPNSEILIKLADFYNTTVDYILGVRDNNFSDSSKSIKIPVLGYVKAGIPIEAVEEILDYEEISQEQARAGDFFALQIKGDSMEPKISEGDVVIVRKQESVDNGDIAVVLINGDDATVKKFYKTDAGIKLVSTNPVYDPFFFTPEEVNSLPVSIIGKVVELRAKF
jgi:repressor LexA